MTPLQNPYPAGTISHVGRWLTDATGRVVMLHGVNMVEKQEPFYPSAFGFGPSDAQWLRANDFDVVRLGVLATGLMPKPGRINERYLNHLATTVAQLRRRHILVLLDLHQDGFGPKVGSDGFPGWMVLTHGAKNTHAGFPNYYFSNPATQQAFQSLWNNDKGHDGVHLQLDVRKMAYALGRRFARTSNVVGYDIFNEPWPGTTWQPCLTSPGGCPKLDRKELDPFYARVDRSLRSSDRRHLLFVEPFVLFNFGSVHTSVTLPGSDPRSGLSFHQYATSAAGSQGVLSNALAWSKRTGGALMDTEWGATTNGAAITTQANQFDQNMIPWIFWSFDQSVVRNIARAPRGANLVTSTVDALVRPHPLMVAGTPTSIAYDPAQRTLRTSWSSQEPDGRTARPGTVSSIEVPRRVYPSGYTVAASGARVISAPCADPVRLAADPGATSASVTITPGGSCAPGT